jgi:hypothetical protein
MPYLLLPTGVLPGYNPGYDFTGDIMLQSSSHHSSHKSTKLPLLINLIFLVTLPSWLLLLLFLACHIGFYNPLYVMHVSIFPCGDIGGKFMVFASRSFAAIRCPVSYIIFIPFLHKCIFIFYLFSLV